MRARFSNDYMNGLLADCRFVDSMAYQDSVNAAMDTAAEHVVTVDKILGRMEEAGLKLKLSKCRFGQRSIDTLAFRVGNGKLSQSDSHGADMAAFRTPTDGSTLLRFLGLVAFFGTFIEHEATKCAPLYEVLKGTEWNKRKPKKQKISVADLASKWGEAQQKAFDGLKAELADPAFSVAPVPGRQTRVVSEASGYGYGAVLLQLSMGKGVAAGRFCLLEAKGRRAALHDDGAGVWCGGLYAYQMATFCARREI
jgi:RNase H-like domain found in reverse transcriptase